MADFVTVVSGAPRSGTSLLMQMLAAGGASLLCDDARPADPDNPRGYFELEAVKRSRYDAGWLDAAEGRAVKVVHALLVALPADRAYRVLSLEREVAEVLASQRALLLRRGERWDPEDEALLARAIARQQVAAERWVEAAPGAALLRVAHAALLADPAREAGRIAGFLGLPLDLRAMAAAVDPALHRQGGPGA